MTAPVDRILPFTHLAREGRTTVTIGRRELLAAIGGAAVAWPLAALAQQATTLVIGYLQGAISELYERSLVAFRAGLNETGYVEGRNLHIEYRVAEQNDRLPALAVELVGHKVAVIFAASLTAAMAAKAATTTIPIVFAGAGDPVKIGLVAGLNRPGGNVTGITSLGVELGPKRLELMRELVPQAVLIGVLTNPTAITTAGNMTDLRAAAGRVGQEVVTLEASTAKDIDAAFTTAANRNFGALLIDVSSFFSDRREQIVALAARHGIAAIYPERVFSEAGGLMSYGASPVTRYRQAGIYVGRILKGEKPSDLPVVQPTKFEFVINLKTAKTLGLQIPDKLLALADEVIE